MEPLFHPITQRSLNAIKAGSASYLFAGPSGSGRALAAKRLAQRLNCAAGGGDDCEICRRIEAGGHPDFLVASSADNLGIGDIERLQHSLAQRPLASTKARVVMIATEKSITIEAQNRLLKTLEEPPPNTTIILLAREAGEFLPTVRSRTQLIKFLPLPLTQLRQFLTLRVGDRPAQAVMILKPKTPGQALNLIQNEAQRQFTTGLIEAAQDFCAGNLFVRLQMVAKSGLGDQAAELIEAMANLVPRNQVGLKQLAAIETAAARLRANVSGRVVLEALAIEL